MKKNLLYHCYVDKVDINESTAFNLRCLQSYIDVFSGRKYLYLSLDNEDLKEKLLDRVPLLLAFDEIHVIKNHPTNRESESLISLLEHVESDQDSLNFYAHSKGNTHPIDETLKNWIFSMYFFNLDTGYLDEVEKQLSASYVVSGIMKKDCRITAPEWAEVERCGPCKWHYSGAFFWLDGKKFFRSDWRTFTKGRLALESFLGQRVSSDEAYCTFLNKSYNFSIDSDLWKNSITPEIIGDKSYAKYHQMYGKL